MRDPFVLSDDERAQGRPGAHRTHGPRATKSTRQNHRYRRIIRPSLRNGFNGVLRALLGDHAWLPPSPERRESVFTALAPASERQDHTTSPSAAASFVRAKLRLTLPRPSHPAPNVRDDRDTPLLWVRDSGNYKFDLGQSRSGIFLRQGVDRFSLATNFCPSGKSITARPSDPTDLQDLPLFRRQCRDRLPRLIHARLLKALATLKQNCCGTIV